LAPPKRGYFIVPFILTKGGNPKNEDMDKEKKIRIVGELTEILDNAKAVFVTDFKGLPMASLNQLRVKVRAAGAKFKVGKNTLAKRAAENGPAKDLSPFLTGNNALAYTNSDPVTLAKALTEFAKEQDKFRIKSGVLGNKILKPEEVTVLSTLPSKDALLASLVGTLSAVPGSLVRVLAGTPRQFLYFLKALEKSKAEKGDALASQAPDNSPAPEAPADAPEAPAPA
jgi:large subunit ribosomal protein L10